MSGDDGLEILTVHERDRDALFALFAAIVDKGEGYPQLPPLSRSEFEASWVNVTAVIGAYIGDQLVGAYYLRPNSPGRGAHIANAGYIVDENHRGCGIGRALVADSITRAPTLGFDAIQFNLVFESNPARPLYEQMGWQVIGRVPEAVEGEDALIYWRRL